MVSLRPGRTGLAPGLMLAAMIWGASMVLFLLVGPGLGTWADSLLTACFGWNAEARRYRLDSLLLALLQPPLFVAVVGFFYADELGAFLRSRRGRFAVGVVAALFLGPASWLLATAEVSATGVPPSAATLRAPIRDGSPAPTFALVDHRGARMTVETLRGAPTVLTFIYTGCHATCPALVGRLQALETNQPEDVRFVAVTIDPERDTPTALAEHATRWGLGERWHLLTGGATAVRRVVEAYGVHVVRLPDGELAHDNVIVLLDRAGRIAFTYRGLAYPEARIEADLQRLVAERG